MGIYQSSSDISTTVSVTGTTFTRNSSQETETGGTTLNSTNDTTPEVKQILLVTHMRSGSTFLGEMFNQNPEVFYWFEPLAALFDMFHKGGKSRNWFHHDDLTPRLDTVTVNKPFDYLIVLVWLGSCVHEFR